jgi:hypothetical protein
VVGGAWRVKSNQSCTCAGGCYCCLALPLPFRTVSAVSVCMLIGRIRACREACNRYVQILTADRTTEPRYFCWYVFMEINRQLFNILMPIDGMKDGMGGVIDKMYDKIDFGKAFL